MNELNIFSKMTLDTGGIWVAIEETISGSYTLYKTQSAYWERGYKFYNSPVYQIFNRAGKRVFACMNYAEAYEHMKIIANEEV
jgi:hypothetical protein